MKLTVFGAGNGGVTAAYHFAKLGHEVCIYDSPQFPTQIEAIQKAGGIKAKDEEDGAKMILPGFEDISLATTNVEEAMAFSDMIVMVCPSFAQEIFFDSMLPHLKSGMKILLMPGNYGGLVLNKILKESDKKDLDITFMDAITIPWACRLTEPGVVGIMGLKEFLSLSVFPKNKANDELKEILESFIPIPVEILDNPIVAGLENINFGGHPMMTTVNIGILENFNGEFNYYKDCCSTATANAAKRMDEERLSVGNALGYKLRTELEAMNLLYNTNEETVYDFNRKSVTHGKIHNAPNSSKARYITEDVPYLLVPCYELAKFAGLEVPVVQAVITLASAYNETNYFETGRTLEKMGLKDLNPEDLKTYFE
ncbi:MAG: NAD/NADP octopine/nopaline dehydrogenase family protein [Tissierellia bacterium]|nr:NAD/NADP octopine/nopaline dehydrogenase family protein [Tissierellia bacterium]